MLYGERESKVRKNGYSERHAWRKVDLGLDVKKGKCIVRFVGADLS